MSISSMTNVAISRRTDDLGRQEEGAAKPPRTAIETAGATGSTEETENTGSAALKTIATFIPTEVIGLYIAALAAVRSGQGSDELGAEANLASAAELRTFWIFLVLTPLMAWAVYAGKVRTAGKPLPARPNTWPSWNMFASAVAFGAWAYALPDSPFTRFDWYTAALGTFVLLVASTALGLLAPIVQKPLRP